MKKLLLVVFVIIFVLTFTTDLLAGGNEPTPAELMKEIKALKQRVSYLEEKIALQDEKLQEQQEQVKEALKHTPGEGIQIPEAGINIGAGATFVVQGAIDANNTGGKSEDVTDVSYSVDLEIEKEFGDFGLAFIHLETADGAGVEDELQVFSNVNRDADDGADNKVSLTEVWYEHYLFDKQLTLTAGKIDPTCFVDQNEIANDETTQFLGRIFRNAPTIDFTDNNAGIHGLIVPEQLPWVELEGQVLDGDGDWEDVGDDIFTTCQINLKPAFLKDLSGNYRIYGWYKDINYIKWADSGQQFEEKYGFGASADQQLSDIFTVFGRYGWCDPDVYASGESFTLEHTWSAGCQLNGKPWGREQDHVALAIGMAMPSDEYKKAGSDLKADDEGHLGVYYSWQVNEHLTLSPDVHIIWNPYGDDHSVSGEKRDDTITVIGCRGQVDF